jgi:hypothetical protein
VVVKLSTVRESVESNIKKLVVRWSVEKKKRSPGQVKNKMIKKNRQIGESPGWVKNKRTEKEGKLGNHPDGWKTNGQKKEGKLGNHPDGWKTKGLTLSCRHPHIHV